MDPRIVKVLAVIGDDCVHSVTVTQLAARVGLSRSRLEHLFKDQTGETVKSRLMNLRFERARALLPDYTLTIKEISFQCGYSSSSSFIREFRRIFSVSPSRCRGSTLRR